MDEKKVKTSSEMLQKGQNGFGSKKKAQATGGKISNTKESLAIQSRQQYHENH